MSIKRFYVGAGLRPGPSLETWALPEKRGGTEPAPYSTPKDAMASRMLRQSARSSSSRVWPAGVSL